VNNDDDKVDLDTVDEAISERHRLLIEANTEMVLKARRRAAKSFATAERLEEMAALQREIGAMNVMAASQLSEIVGDMISGEFDIEFIDSGTGEDDEDDDGE
jgi:hypothetical protein